VPVPVPVVVPCPLHVHVGRLTSFPHAVGPVPARAMLTAMRARTRQDYTCDAECQRSPMQNSKCGLYGFPVRAPGLCLCSPPPAPWHGGVRARAMFLRPTDPATEPNPRTRTPTCAVLSKATAGHKAVAPGSTSGTCVGDVPAPPSERECACRAPSLVAPLRPPDGCQLNWNTQVASQGNHPRPRR